VRQLHKARAEVANLRKELKKKQLRNQRIARGESPVSSVNTKAAPTPKPRNPRGRPVAFPTSSPKDRRENTDRRNKSSAPQWLANNPKWTRDTPEFRSSALSDIGENGPASNILKENDSIWNAGVGGREHWVVLDLESNYELSQIEIMHDVDELECPRECRFQYSIAGGPWVTVCDFKCSDTAQVEVGLQAVMHNLI